MSISSGSIVGGNGVPAAKLIINTETAGAEAHFTVCLNRESQGADTQFNYELLIPKKIGCDINLRDAMTADTYTATLMGLSPDGGWVVPAGSATLDLNPTENEIVCFDRFTLAVVPDGVYCDLIVCIDGGFVLPPCKVIQGCENFCVYASKLPDTETDPANST
jgi:hypothetical protein